MRRDQSATSLGPPSPSSLASQRFCYRNLNLLAFAGTLLYIGFLIGNIDNDDRSNNVPSVRKFSDVSNSNNNNGGAGGRIKYTDLVEGRQQAASVDNMVASKWDNIIKLGHNNDNKAKQAKDMGHIINKDNKGKVTTINLIGERHSGTNWITDHLTDCFGTQISVQTNFTRFKHWFQFDDDTIRNESALVIAMFRDPYDWIEAMRERPHHAHEHIGMEWKDFVTKPWVGPRKQFDWQKMTKAKEENYHIEKWGCLAGYNFDEVIPCSAHDSTLEDGYSNYMYELKNDESHRAYGSIVELRSEKIRNFVKVPTFTGVKAFFPQRYEELNKGGTAEFLKEVESVSGLKAKCEPFPGSGKIKHKVVDPEFMEWMNRYHDWEAEAMIGYEKREPIPLPEDRGQLTWEQELLGNSTRQSNAQAK